MGGRIRMHLLDLKTLPWQVPRLGAHTGMQASKNIIRNSIQSIRTSLSLPKTHE